MKKNKALRATSQAVYGRTLYLVHAAIQVPLHQPLNDEISKQVSARLSVLGTPQLRSSWECLKCAITGALPRSSPRVSVTVTGIRYPRQLHVLPCRREGIVIAAQGGQRGVQIHPVDRPLEREASPLALSEGAGRDSRGQRGYPMREYERYRVL